MCVSIFSTILSEKFLIIRINQRDMIISVHLCLCKEPTNSCDILIKLDFRIVFIG